MGIWKRARRPIPQELLVVRGARFHSEEIKKLLKRPVPIPEEKQQGSGSAPGILEDSLVYQGTATLTPEPENEFDPNAIAVIVEGKRVGYISRTKAKQVGKIIGSGVEVDCTVFWNGDPDADYQFYTVQLFSQNRVVYDDINDSRYISKSTGWRFR